MTEASNEARLERLVGRVFADLAARSLVPKVEAGGAHPVVVAFEDELIAELMKRVELSGGSANAFIEMRNGKIETLSMHSAAAHAPSPKAEDLRGDPIRKNIEVGMLVVLASQNPDGVIVRIQSPRHTGQVEYVDRGELLPA